MDFLRDPYTFVANRFQEFLTGLGLAPEWVLFISFLTGAFILATSAMLLVTMLIWIERKIVARVQDRFGPNRVGPWGIFQSFADLIKIFTKEMITPTGSDWLPYNLAPVLAVSAVLTVWAVLPFTVTFYGVNLSVGVLFVIALGAVGEMGIILAGWGSNNKYALLAAFRAIAQLISYGVPLAITMLIPVMFSGSMALNDIVLAQDVWYIFLAPLVALIFFVTNLAEIGRAPFDLVEAESELVSGFNVEYSGLKFGMFYVAEFLHALTVSLIFATLFLGGWRGPGAVEYPVLGIVYYTLKTSLVYFLIILLRASLPRFRIDQMMAINWKLLIPLSLSLLMLTALVYRLVFTQPHIVRVLVLLAVNGIVFGVLNLILARVEKRNSRRPLVAEPRPVARAESISSNTPVE
ncbi:MAG: NADH-quinone oxidoreductase subunit NuoH [Anaerolineae bacterium]|nr:NADH-quinone oxidoreductase subunit NuoH [Anaerolineae bacterium]